MPNPHAGRDRGHPWEGGGEGGIRLNTPGNEPSVEKGKSTTGDRGNDPPFAGKRLSVNKTWGKQLGEGGR